MNVAFIPVRGGSKSIPMKNIREMNGKPLVYWVVRAACLCRKIDKVYVATESRQISDVVSLFKETEGALCAEKLEVISRSAESASDYASTESAMLEFAENHEFDNIVLIQATSPLLQQTDLDAGFGLFSEEGTDSVLSVVRQKRFQWAYSGNGCVQAVNYDVDARPRRQDFEGYLVENGAFYITSRARLLETKNRISGRIRAVEMQEDTFFEIDELSDWDIVEQLLKKRDYVRQQARLSEIKMVLTDCDGCLTDGGMYYSEDGAEMKKFHTRDGVGFAMLKDKGMITGIITGENVELVRRRACKLNLDIYESGCRNKLETVEAVCRKYGLTLKEVLYIGDDVNDLTLLQRVGFSCCPFDAVEPVRKSVSYVAAARGGRGVVREIAELLV